MSIEPAEQEGGHGILQTLFQINPPLQHLEHHSE